MSFNPLEWSIFGGKPVELFRFSYGTTRYLYTSGDEDVSFSGEMYRAALITRSKISASTEISKNEVTITVPRDNAVAVLYLGTPPDAVINVTIRAFHKGDTEFVVLWQGRITGVTFVDSEANITCESLFTSLRRPGLRAMYQIPCRHELYSAMCGVISESHKVSTTVTAVNGNIVTVAASAMANGWATGGLFTTNSGAKRWIMKQQGGVLTLDNSVKGLAVGPSVAVYAGCAQSLDVCWNKFNNGLNFGGFPYIPDKNPFVGDPIM